MKVLVVYYSRSGNTKKVAQAISNAFKCDIEEINDTANRKGIIGWLFAGRDGMKKNLTKIKDVLKDLGSYDTVIIGGPIWSWSLSAPVRTFLMQYKDQLKNVAFFCTEGGAGAENAFRSMEEITEKRPVAKLVVKELEVKTGRYPAKVSGFVDEIRTGRA